MKNKKIKHTKKIINTETSMYNVINIYISKKQLKEYLDELEKQKSNSICIPYILGSNIITTDMKEAPDIKCYYKGRLITNVTSLTLYGPNMKFLSKKTT